MDKKNRFWAIGAFLGLLVLTLDGKTAIQGAYNGIELCLRTVIPSLFPFFLLSNIIVTILSGSDIRLLLPLGKLFGIPVGMESLLIPAFLGGYPIGAQAVTVAWRNKQIPKIEAERLLSFCNNAGPSFLFGMAGALFENNWTAWILWVIQIVSSLLTATLIPSGENYSGEPVKGQFSLQTTFQNTLKSMCSVCGWVILFRILITFLQRWFLWMFPVEVQCAIIGGLELSNGCISLFDVENTELRFVLCSAMLSFGGLCVAMQTFSVSEGLSCKYFLIGKTLQTVLSIGISAAIVLKEQIVLSFIILLIPMFFLKIRKNSSNPSEAGV